MAPVCYQEESKQSSSKVKERDYFSKFHGELRNKTDFDRQTMKNSMKENHIAA